MTLLAQYTEDLRYFHPYRRAMVVIAREGVVLRKTIDDEDWRLCARKKPEIPYDDWLAAKRAAVAALPAWAAEITELPSLEEIETWVTDALCPTPTGDDVEPDGTGPDGAPSWLRVLGFV